MLVKYIDSNAHDLISGEIYPVLEVLINVDSISQFRVCPPFNNTTLQSLERQGTPAYSMDKNSFLLEVNSFRIVDSGIPENWGLKMIKNNLFFQPMPWIKNGFWEAYYNDEEWAEKLFDQEVQKIQNFHELG